MTGWQFDTAKTQNRYEQLQAYYQEKGLNAEKFACKHFAECLGSQKNGVVKQYAGGTAGLTPFYDVAYNGTPIRILIIGKEASYNPKQFKFGTADNFDARSKQCLDTIYFVKTRTKHIKGTLLTLQRIFEVESDYVYATYALSNALRCAFQREEIAMNTSSLQDTGTMRTNCAAYLVDEIKILEPTLIIAQGAWAVEGKYPLVEQLSGSVDGQVKPLLKNATNSKYGLYEFPDFMMITSHHPSAQGGSWEHKYAPDSLWPMIDYLKTIGYLPRIAQADAEVFEQLIKPAVPYSPVV